MDELQLSDVPSSQILHSQRTSSANERDIRSDQPVFSPLFRPEQQQEHFQRVFADIPSPFSVFEAINIL